MQARSYISMRETPIKDEVQLAKRKERMSSRRKKKVIKKRKKRSADALEIVIVFSSALLAERFGTFFFLLHRSQVDRAPGHDCARRE